MPGDTILFERLYSEGRPERLAELAAELVRRRVDIIWCNAPPSAVAAARATKTIPIVFWGVALPVELGLVDSLGRPGRNVTGVAFSAGPEMITKHLQLLKAIAPQTRRLARLGGQSSIEHVDDRTIIPAVSESPYAAHSMEGRRFFFDDRDKTEAVFASILQWQADAIYAFGDPATYGERQRIVDFAKRHRLSSAFGMKDFVSMGGLFSYGPDTAATIRRSALYIDLYRPHFKGRETVGVSRRAAVDVRVGHQSEDCACNWSSNSRGDPAPRRPCDRVRGDAYTCLHMAGGGWAPCPDTELIVEELL